MATKAEKLMAFLLCLQTSRSARKRFERRPGAEMRRFGLDEITIKAVIGKDHEKLWKIVAGGAHVMTATGVREGRRRRKAKRS